MDLVIQFYDDDDELLAEESFSSDSGDYEQAVQEAEIYANAIMSDFDATYFQIS